MSDEPDGWDKVEAAELQSVAESELQRARWETALTLERGRCADLIKAEIEEGTKRGIPITSGTMIILHRLALAIEHG
jgi:hypothetical protein